MNFKFAMFLAGNIWAAAGVVAKEDGWQPMACTILAIACYLIYGVVEWHDSRDAAERKE